MKTTTDLNAPKRRRTSTAPVQYSRLIFFTHMRRPGYTEIPDPRVSYLAYAHEACPATGRHYLRGYAFGARMSAAAWKEIFDEQHVELCRGHIHDRPGFKGKVDEMVEHGERPAERVRKAKGRGGTK